MLSAIAPINKKGENRKMYKKKLSTIAIITILTLSILLAAMPMAYAISDPTFEDPITHAGVTDGPVGTKINVVGTAATAYGKVEVYWDTLATKLGEGYADGATDYEIKNVVIPEDLVGPHDVIVFDVLASTIGDSPFDITSEIKLSTPKGLPGDSVTVTGTGFGDELAVGIYLGAITNVPTEPVTITPGVSVTGTLTNSPVVIASVDILTDVTITGLVGGEAIDPAVTVLDISVTDDGEGNLAGAALNVAVQNLAGTLTGEVNVAITGTINYATGAITLTASGTDSSGADPVTAIVVTIDACDATYDYADYDMTPVAGVTTDELGSFVAVIMVPAIAEGAYGAYTVTALDTDANTATATLTVDYYVTVTPLTGPTGITITIAGRIEATTAYELRFNGAPVDSGTSGADGAFSGTYLIPTVLSIGSYPVDVVWKVTKIKTATFQVTAPPRVIYAPTSGVAGTVVKISTIAGYPFSAGSNISAYLGTTLVNSTQLDDRFGPTVAFGPAAGSFTNLEFTVPTLTPGPYALKVVDQFGASTAAIYTFTVLATPVSTVTLNAASYYQGDTLSFTIFTTETSFTAGPTVTIRAPTGSIWWTDTWTLTPVGPTSSVQYQDQVVNGNPLTLPADAPLGSWNWTITYKPVSTGLSTKATGLFTVAALPTMQTVLDQLDAMEATITGVITTTEGDIIAVINTKTGTITSKLDPLMPKLQAIEDTAVIIATMLGEVQVDIAALDLAALDALGVDITAIKGDVATIKTNIGTVTASVSALDAKVTSLSGDVATVSTTLGTLEGTVTSIDGKVATIDTDVGTLQADISDVSSKVDTTPAWIAVVLSLIAAIAAIFAVITIRQKIAG